MRIASLVLHASRSNLRFLLAPVLEWDSLDHMIFFREGSVPFSAAASVHGQRRQLIRSSVFPLLEVAISFRENATDSKLVPDDTIPMNLFSVPPVRFLARTLRSTIDRQTSGTIGKRAARRTYRIPSDGPRITRKRGNAEEQCRRPSRIVARARANILEFALFRCSLNEARLFRVKRGKPRRLRNLLFAERVNAPFSWGTRSLPAGRSPLSRWRSC